MTTFILESHVGSFIYQHDRVETDSRVFCFTSERLMEIVRMLTAFHGVDGFTLHVMRIMHNGVHGTVDIDRIWG